MLLWAAVTTAPIVGASLVTTPVVASAQTTSAPGALTSAQAQALSVNVSKKVIVVLKDQAPTTPPSPALAGRRAAIVGQSQSPLLSELTMTGSKAIHTYNTINAIAATVSPAEASRLQSNPSVSEVVADQVIHLASPAATAAQVAAATGPPTAPLPNACAPNGQVQLDPQAIEQIHADSQNPSAPTARSLNINGKGVSVGFIADGLDINNPDFIRANGQHVFTDYKDFSGEGTGAPTGGGEAFLDASSVAAQGRQTYDVSHYSDLPLNQPCNIRVEGVAPGASLVGLNIFGNEDAGYNSEFLQAIDYAVSVDHVNVLNESLGSNPYPDDSASLDLIKAANDMAVAAGTTVAASSGDAGITNTLGAPSTDPNVISAGATTTYRIDAQIGYGGARFPGITGWLNNNISSFSSSGFDQRGATVSLVAPGELNWALCTPDVKLYTECTNYAGQPSPVQATGGTSESAPLTAGVAALVIEAYRGAHGGASPTPAVIKQILTSTADDIGLPADQQGAGLIDAYKAVQAAKSYKAPPASGHPTGSTVLTSAGQINEVAAAGTTEKPTETVTNNGTSTQTVNLSTRAIGPFTASGSGTVNLSDTASSHALDWQGINDNYGTVPFTVPAGQNRLNAAITFQNASATNLNARVRLTLVDPNGNLAGYSVPQGDGNYGDLQVTNPVAGNWTAYIYSRDSKDGGTTGPVAFGASVATYTTFGTVSPPQLRLAPGQSGQATLTVATPPTPGDATGAILLSAPAGEPSFGGVTTVPVTLRSLVPPGPTSFSGVLTGGNGRQANLGQTQYYQVPVAAGKPELNSTVTLANNPNNQFYAFLVDPAGQAEAFSANDLLGNNAGGGISATNTLGAQLHVIAPMAGTWTLIVEFAPQVSGTALSEPFTVRVNETPVPASAPGLPTSGASLKAGKAKTVYVKVTNNGTSPEAYFIDGRLSTQTQVNLTALNSPDTTVPLNVTKNVPVYLVPSDTTSIIPTAVAGGSEPIQFDASYFNGDPDLASNVGQVASASLNENPVAPGAWGIAPDVVGPFGATPATPEPVHTSMTATTAAFDPGLSSPTGDIWQESINPAATYNTYVVNPGQTATIPVTITPTGGRGTIVSGTLYVDDANLIDFNTLVPNANQVAALPYSYTVR